MKIRSVSSFAAVSLAAALFVTGTAQAEGLQPFNATYKATYMGMSGTGKMSLSQSGSRYKAVLSVDAMLGSAAYSSVFDASGAQWKMVSSADNRKFVGKKLNRSGTFDWGKGEARWSGDVKADRQGPIKLQAGDVDPLALDLALVRDVKAGKPLRYRMLENGKAKTMNFTVAGKENVTVGGKTVSATKVVRNDKGDELAVWVADGYPVPVRLRQTDDGAVTDLKLQSVN
ncbi:DUF3108 domain-containing protein [Lysobacter soyae]|jgi:hypothetical protein|uniref:DUF3108 domain-containing protein n=1 Tax=Lysobacter soyae TaxID=2764185 RepID=A0ABX8WLT9_9GAMM|nr:DUF3108 domain-containing protein [Lysobacter sp. CJ11]QYR52602.1 DUF3108 domain-containing protein [Lysobacter sp. CJ11]